MKVFWSIACVTFLILAGAAVWMGGLNQDEGWYLYAANLVARGEVPYRDFFYTQGPLMPIVYSAFTWIWREWGLLGARIFTLLIGTAGLVFAIALARRLAPEGRRGTAGLVAFLLLGGNLYHLYFQAIPKTYALAGFLVIVGFYLLSIVAVRGRWALAALAGLALAFAAGTRISLGMLLVVGGLWLLGTSRWKPLIAFSIGGFFGLGIVYGPFLIDAGAREGLFAAQAYHAARGGFDPVWTIGSFSRLVRWYLPTFVTLGLWLLTSRAKGENVRPSSFAFVTLAGFLVVFIVQMFAPFPYEDYQVPIMGLLTVAAAAGFASLGGVPHGALQAPSAPSCPSNLSNPSSLSGFLPLLVLGMVLASSFGSPLLEEWSTNGKDRFWSLKKEAYELPQLREVARRIEALDPGGTELLTQDLYLAIETGRTVPKGLEMGPFSILTDDEWRRLLGFAKSPIAAMSGYAFAIEPPKCNERPLERQLEYWGILKRNYEFVERVDAFGQNSTPLLILRRK